MERATIDGQPAWIHGGLHACAFTEAIVFAGGRVYEFGALMENQSIFDRTLFDTILGSVQLDP
jgi:hypothetical protein